MTVNHPVRYAVRRALAIGAIAAFGAGALAANAQPAAPAKPQNPTVQSQAAPVTPKSQAPQPVLQTIVVTGSLISQTAS